MNKLTLRDGKFEGERVLMRVDFNVPLDEGLVADDTRIKCALLSIEYVLDRGASLILMSHLGRPKGKRVESLSLAPVASTLCHLLKRPVLLAPDCVGKDVEDHARKLRPGEVMLLENLRFHLAEEKPETDPSFAEKLAKLGTVYIDDAFGTAHRKHTSTYTLPKAFPGKAFCGFIVEREVAALSQLLTHPKQPFYALIGGAKIGGKIAVLQALSQKVKGFFIGGGMAYTFFKAQKIPIGDSLCDEEHLHTAKSFMEYCQRKSIPLYLPEDVVIADRFDPDPQCRTIRPLEGIPEGWQGMDIGPLTIEKWSTLFQEVATIFWNGPMGVFEFPRFALGTHAIAKRLSALPIETVVGGGDSVAAINHLNLADFFTHISTGGGASLEYLEKGHLPGIDVLSDKAPRSEIS